jgi:carbamate kinase
MTVAECREHLADGHFAAGSMRPKIESALRFLEQGGEEVIITQPHNLQSDLRSIYGTHIVP